MKLQRILRWNSLDHGLSRELNPVVGCGSIIDRQKKPPDKAQRTRGRYRVENKGERDLRGKGWERGETSFWLGWPKEGHRWAWCGLPSRGVKSRLIFGLDGRRKAIDGPG
uniref:Uncharacterized protein n=1 Tax=Cannabis sativa TaxID=3483 RepID=A0A803NI89_CANSA